ncbi:MAG: response regulator transcription factor [Granulosicoccaceae bacterium]
MHPVLLIDDDGKLGEVLTEYCAQFSIAIDPALTPSAGLKKLAQHRFDAVILDVMLPEMNGFDVCREIRKTSDIPIIMLTARGDVTDRIVGLEIGADDYLPKPFDPRELVARLLSNIKRHIASSHQVESSPPVMHYEGLSIHPIEREVRIADKAVELTTKEYDLLLLLAEQPSKAFNRDEILQALRGAENELFSRSVDILVSRLRAKLKPIIAIKTVHGAGYTFTLPKRDL